MKQEKTLRLGIKAGLGIFAGLFVYQLVRDAVQGHAPSVGVLFTGLVCLNQVGKRERKAANIGQKLTDSIVGASFVDTIKHYANNVTAGALTVNKKIDRALTQVLR